MTYLIVGGALIQSTFGVGNFEVVVFSPPFGNNPLGALTHYWLDTSRPPNVWQRGRDISIAATGAGCIIQSSFGSPGNFEVVVPEPDGLAHYWHDNSDMMLPW
jgi:hypothetical protein